MVALNKLITTQRSHSAVVFVCLTMNFLYKLVSGVTVSGGGGGSSTRFLCKNHLTISLYLFLFWHILPTTEIIIFLRECYILPKSGASISSTFFPKIYQIYKILTHKSILKKKNTYRCTKENVCTTTGKIQLKSQDQTFLMSNFEQFWWISICFEVFFFLEFYMQFQLKKHFQKFRLITMCSHFCTGLYTTVTTCGLRLPLSIIKYFIRTQHMTCKFLLFSFIVSQVIGV